MYIGGTEKDIKLCALVWRDAGQKGILDCVQLVWRDVHRRSREGY